MEQSKSRKHMDRLEKYIKKKLQERTISPSPAAWDKVLGELKPKEDGSSTKKDHWWAVAAGFAAIILLLIGFFDKLPPRNVDEVLVLEKEHKKESRTKIRPAPPIKDEIVVSPRRGLVLEVSELQKHVKEEEWGLKNKDHGQVANNGTHMEREALNDVKQAADLAIANKLKEVLAQVNAMENNAIRVSDAEIDTLLMNAQRELLTNKALNKNGKVDAMALLNEVELELYDDQRNPLFIKLKEGFFRLRTAVADRNN